MTSAATSEPDIARMAEDALVGRIGVVVGYTPLGTRDLLHVLAHPDVIEFTKDYIAARDENGSDVPG